MKSSLLTSKFGSTSQAHNGYMNNSGKLSSRSLLHILRLLGCHECPQAQMVAAWAIANLILLHSFKYIR